MENTETNVTEQVTDAVEETAVNTETSTEVITETSLQSEIDTLKKLVDELKGTNSETVTDKEKPAETTEGTAEETVVETDTTEVQVETKDEEHIDKVDTGIDPALQERLNAQSKEIENLKKEMAKLRKANEFTSTGNSTSQNNNRGKSYSDGDIKNFRWKI